MGKQINSILPALQNSARPGLIQAIQAAPTALQAASRQRSNKSKSGKVELPHKFCKKADVPWGIFPSDNPETA
jgi:hypothetical protein